MKYIYISIIVSSLHSIAICAKPECNLPLAVEAKIQRHATVSWQSDAVLKNGASRVAVLYSVPIVGANDSLKYLEIFEVDEDGGAISKDRIYLGGRGLYVVDSVEMKDNVYTVNAREHGNDDAIASPSLKVKILIDCSGETVKVTKAKQKL